MDDEWVLGEEENKAFFEGRIIGSITSELRPPDRPVINFIGGQAAAGKTSTQNETVGRIGPAHTIVADFDALLEYHPHYATLLTRDDRIAAHLIGADSYAWLQQLIRYAGEQRYNLVRETAMTGKGVESESNRFRSLGYRVEADALAVPEAVSRLGILSRYQRMRDEIGFGRYVATEVHDGAYNGIPQVLAEMDEHGIVDALRIRRFGGEIIYENSWDGAAGKWSKEPEALRVLEAERARPFSAETKVWFEQTMAHLADRLPDDLKSQLPDIRDLARPLGIGDKPGQSELEESRQALTPLSGIFPAQGRSPRNAPLPASPTPNPTYRSVPPSKGAGDFSR